MSRRRLLRGIGIGYAVLVAAFLLKWVSFETTMWLLAFSYITTITGIMLNE